ncbi:MAG: hypothetical protein R2792_11050 [Saprospiraceae bacterium]
MTSLPTLLLSFAIIGAILTLATKMAKKTDNTLWTFLQHFCGVWFIFSGLVKAIDPIGTAYKMEDYFAQFESTFEGLDNIFSGLAPLFPFLASYSTGFSIFMIVLEIALGVMLMIGYRKKLTAWLFFLIVFFFTVLTGFTYLTGYVPSTANFFDFGSWGPYIKTQMRVTDCGCFGDFIKLDPKVSFFKDLALMVPALMFLLFTRNKHELFTKRQREIITAVTVFATLVFCYQNTYRNLPVVDFRPFNEGKDVRARKEVEEQARANMEILGWVLENEKTGEVTTFMEPVPGEYSYYKTYKKDEGWSVKEQIKTDPFIEENGKRVPITESKISDFAIESMDNVEMTEDILAEEGYSLMIVAYHFYGERKMSEVTVQDTIYATDTIQVSTDSIRFEQRIESIQPKQIEREQFIPTDYYAGMFNDKVKPLADAAQAAGWKVYGLVTYSDRDNALDLGEQLNLGFPFYMGDDKLLKTIIRANPGVVVWKDGKIIAKYHHRHIPGFDQIRK